MRKNQPHRKLRRLLTAQANYSEKKQRLATDAAYAERKIVARAATALHIARLKPLCRDA